LSNLERFYNTAIFHYRNFNDDTNSLYHYYYYMLQFARSLNLNDLDNRPVTLGWVVGYLNYHNLAKSHCFKLDSLADKHQLSGWSEAQDLG
jgi:hypothetical protein